MVNFAVLFAELFAVVDRLCELQRMTHCVC